MKPEVIVKLHFLLDITGDEPVPIPQVELFANQRVSVSCRDTSQGCHG